MTKKLSKCRQGVRYIIKQINGTDETKKHLRNIGLQNGDSITIISKISGNFVINVKDGRFGIDERIAKLIEVIK